MKIAIRLSVGGELVREAHITVDDLKLQELSEEEKESALDILVRDWADRNLHIEWEAQDTDEA